MTAEIALLNRSALAFAADSAVTLRMGTDQKIYDSAEKIFELSRVQPIGIMIYNNVEHVGIPLEVLIRKFRQEQSANTYASVQDAAATFLSYVEGIKHSGIEERVYLYNVLSGVFERLNRDVRKDFGEQFANGIPPSKHREPSEILLEKIDLATKEEQARPLAGYLEDVTEEEFREKYAESVSRAAKDTLRFITPKGDALTVLVRLALAVVRSSARSDMHTGLVIGGFAANELFPTMVYMEADGIYFGKLKVLSSEVVDIDRDGDRAQLVPFAQKEMVDRFIYGIDDDFQEALGKYVLTAVNEVMSARRRSFKPGDRAAIRETVLDGFNRMVTELRHAEKQSVLDILTFMSKKELADMAHVLVELTSKKRRFSRDQETVGGPIDVAIITRNEGFIWIKRKHYFDRSENPAYFARSFALNRGDA